MKSHANQANKQNKSGTVAGNVESRGNIRMPAPRTTFNALSVQVKQLASERAARQEPSSQLAVVDGQQKNTQGEESQPLQIRPFQLKAVDEQEKLQMKAATFQLKGAEDEEPSQMKAAPIQLKGLEEEEPLQKQSAPFQLQGLEDEEPLQKQAAPFHLKGIEEEEPLHKQPFQLAKINTPAQQNTRPNQTGMPDNLKAGVEALSGMAMDDVKVHYNSDKPAQLQALAYAQGSDIHIAPGQEKHLPHEAWHVVQQKQGRVKPTMQMKGGVAVNDDKGLESEADVMGAHSLKMKSIIQKLAVHEKKETPLQMKSFPQQANQLLLNSAPQTRLVNTPGNGSLLQFQLNPQNIVAGTKPKWGIDEGFRTDILKKIRSYNANETRSNATKKNVHGNIAALDTIEHLVYSWFDENKTDRSNNNRRGLFSLLDDVQVNHKYWVGVNVENEYDMWTKDAVDGDERTAINTVWAHVVNGTGAFEFLATIQTMDGGVGLPASVLEKFKGEVFASLARLYSRPKGRELLKALDAGKADDKTVKFVLSPLYKILGTGMLPNPYVGAKASSILPGDPFVRVRGVKMKNRKLVRGKGGSAQVEIAPGIKDGSMVDFDTERNAIVSPNFIGIGHELIHAAHYGAGTYIGEKPGIGAPHAKIPGDYGHDVEEFLTISSKEERSKAKNIVTSASVHKLASGTQQHGFRLSELDYLNKGIPNEADIREEHGLSIRHGHSSSANPARYPGVSKHQDPGTVVRDGVEWITPEIRKITPPPPQAIPPAPVAAQPAVVDNSWRVRFWRKFGYYQ